MSATHSIPAGATREGDAFAVPPGAVAPDAPALGYAEIQRLVDRAAHHDFLTRPGSVQPHGAGSGAGWRLEQPLHRFDIEMGDPRTGVGVVASNIVRGRVGTLSVDLRILPWEFAALPERAPPPTPLDRSQSQRIAFQRVRLDFGGGDGLEAFGTGRTLPAVLLGRPQLVVAGVANVLAGHGRFAGAEGNFTFCGELTAEGALDGHFMLRLVDPDGRFRAEPLRPHADERSELPAGVTFLTYLAQKGETTRSANVFSHGPDGRPRGVNIPVDLKRVRLAGGGLEIGGEIGKEIGFGRETKPRSAGSGTGDDPFQFEGVSAYDFYGPDGRTIARFSANFLEGRTFAMALEGAPGVPALRFGYYGVITDGRGQLAGLDGILYGAAGSVFLPPPAEHVITNLYVARVGDPEGRFRRPPGAAGGGGR